MNPHLDEIVEAFSNPGLYPHAPSSVKFVQTHISLVFLAGDFVYKIKKPMNFGFLDFTTQEKREYFCEREVELNSRFSKGIYIGVIPIHKDSSGVNLDGRGDKIETAVLMKRIPDDRLMLDMLERDRVDPALLDRLADTVAGFHRAAPSSPEISHYGAPEVVRYNVEENFIQTQPFIGRTIDRETYDEISDRSMGFLKENRGLFAKRVAGGFIRDCHGDLHLEHIIVLDEIYAFDCIEFNDRFRYGDVASDMGFLLMDLTFRGYPAFARRVLDRYELTAKDDGVREVVRFYQSYRAFVRGKVVGLTLDEEEVSAPDKLAAKAEARDYFKGSLAFLKPRPRPVLVIMCGLSGSGKSFLASRLAERLGVDRVRSDVARKVIFGLSPEEHRLDKYGHGIYTSEATERTYAELRGRASQSLSRGETIILDASFSSRERRSEAMKLAADLNAGFLIVKCECPDKTLRSRLRMRAETGDDPSDAGPAILERQRCSFQDLGLDEEPYVRTWDSTTDHNRFLGPLAREIIFGE